MADGGSKKKRRGLRGWWGKKGKEKNNNNNNNIIIKFKSRNQNYVPNTIFKKNCDLGSETKTTYETKFFLQS